MSEFSERLRALVLAARALDDVLEDGEAYQWHPSPTKGASSAEGGRASGGPPSDPTGDAVTDPRRLRLRAEVDAAHRALALAQQTVEVATRRLSRALDAWAGAGE